MSLKRFLSHLQYEKRYSVNTLTAYETDLKQFFDYLKKEYDTEDIPSITHFFIRSWIVSLIDAKISPRSVNRKITSLKSFFRFQQREKLLDSNPMLKIQSPKVGKKLPAFIDVAKMDLLFTEIQFEEGFRGIRDKVILELFYGTGMRLSELVNLVETDINFSNQHIKVLGKRNKERIIPLSGNMIMALKQYLTERTVFINENNSSTKALFLDNRCNKIYTKFVYRLVKKYLGQVTTGDKKNPHVLRHTFATHMLNNGAEINAVKEILGHSSLAATQVYTHNTIEKLKNIYKQAHPKA
ncbi:MAG TPA: tyrosine-type recombinase/integrase [Bacteroidia bacterium]|nr:tyrosine-type recombinase/integrase [Bacteroidia bacterium]